MFKNKPARANFITKIRQMFKGLKELDFNFKSRFLRKFHSNLVRTCLTDSSPQKGPTEERKPKLNKIELSGISSFVELLQ